MKAFLKNKFCGAIAYLVAVNLIVLVIILAYRLVFLYAGYDNISSIDNKYTLIAGAFFLGLHYDGVVMSYISVIPLLTLPVLGITNRINKFTFRIFNTYYIITYAVVFLITCIDIPYFQYFFQHINASVFNWADYGVETAGMVFAEKTYYGYFAIYLISVVLFSLSLIFSSRRILKTFKYNFEKKYIAIAFVTLLFSYIFCFFGTKGRFRKPGTIEVKNAYVTSVSFINQMAINPVFYMYLSFDYKSTVQIPLMDSAEALKIAGENLNIDLTNNGYSAKKTISDTLNKPHNIIIVIVESFTDDYLGTKIGEKQLMPYINNLIDNSSSYYFDNFYSQGSHTNQGIASSLYGFPSLFERQMLRKMDLAVFGRAVLPTEIEDEMQNTGAMPLIYKGLPQDLKKHGYETMFFLTHNPNFDNTGVFLTENGIDRLYSMENFPQSAWVSVWGVNDEFLFKYALSRIDSCSASGKPFFAGLMTISNHPPYSLPEGFNALGVPDDQKAMAYTDHCIQAFMEEASKKEWYDNTIFLFLGDHGKILGASRYDMPLALNHVPLIIHSPLLADTPKRIHDPAGQIDIYPTVMGLLKQEPSFNSFGVDVLNEKRKYIYFTSDEKLGCTGDNLFYVYNVVSGQQFLYDMRSHNNIIGDEPAVADSMRLYSFSMIEAAKYILKNELGKSD